MKRMLCVLGAALLLCACGSTAQEPPQTTDSGTAAFSQAEQTAPQAIPARKIVPPEETSLPEETEMQTTQSDAAQTLRSGVYINASDESEACDEQYRPYLALYPDGTCVYYENYYSGCVDYNGTYTPDGDTLTLELSDDEGSHTATMTVSPDGTLAYRDGPQIDGYSAITKAGDRFVLSARSLPER